MYKNEVDWTIFWRSMGNILINDDEEQMINKLKYSF